jgi:bifunctional non-homologous end joining protein LigD
MSSRPGPLPSGSGWSFELKWDGFRALVSTEDGLRVRSRRDWNMTEVLPELRGLPTGLVLDGELVAWKSQPYFPLICRRVLNRDMSVPMSFVIFDVLRRDGNDLTGQPYVSRRTALQELRLDGPGWTTSETFGDGPALFDAVCKLGLEGVVAKRLSSRYRPGHRDWIKTKTRATGVATPSERRCSGHGRDGRLSERAVAQRPLRPPRHPRSLPGKLL